MTGTRSLPAEPRGRIVRPVAGALALCGILFGSPALASCAVVGDSVGVGLAQALPRCTTSARVGISSAAAARRVQSGDRWLIVSIGSNDFPRGISAAQRAASDKHVRGALSRIVAAGGSRVIVVVPANAARSTVASWVAAHGVPSVSFAAGRDGIHPASYAALAARVRAMTGE